MASTRKKQDEKNLRTLRELVSLGSNRHCFDCNQRGPTYVDVTIGSFVCTKCSGMLRGLTPPHRVKSISMAAFSQDEVEVLRTRGNDYNQRVWLGLYEGPKPTERDEQALHQLMLDKYERKRYYMEPSVALRNGYNKPEKKVEPVKEHSSRGTSIIAEPRPHSRTNGYTSTPTTNGKNEFVADFAHAEIFNAANNNSNDGGFANFDNNPIFNNEGAVQSLQQTMSQPKPVATNGPPAPSEDRYAALKDLDNALKSQPAVDWNSGGSSSSLYSSPTAAGSFYSSTASPQSSSYGSPSQGQFMNLFAAQESSSNVSNPFNTNNAIWNTSNGNTNGANPFRSSPDTFGMNGGNGSYQSMFGQPINGMAWTPNPFKVVNGHSNNPFL